MSEQLIGVGEYGSEFNVAGFVIKVGLYGSITPSWSNT